MERRNEKLVSLIRNEAAAFIETHADRDPGSVLTVTHVKLSADYRYADIYVSIFPATRVGTYLEKFRRWQHEFNTYARQTLLLKNIPAVRFKLDEEYIKQEHIEKLLEENK